MLDALAVVGIAAAPVAELRGAIPWAVVEFGYPWYQAMALAVIGNLLPVLILPWALHRTGHLLYRSPQPVRGLLQWRMERLESRSGASFAKYGRWALVPLVAIPLPFTGAWTGCLAAWGLNIHPRRSIPFIALGVLIAAVVVTALTELGVSVSLFLAGEPK